MVSVRQCNEIYLFLGGASWVHILYQSRNKLLSSYMIKLLRFSSVDVYC